MFFLVTQSFNIFAQEFSIENFTAREGLANDNIRSMAIDSSGFLWIATWDGISRYDGYTFKNFYHHPNDSLSLPYFSIQQIMIDGGNNLWLLTDDFNVAWFDRNNGIFVSLDRLYQKMAKPYRSICVDESGFMWIVKSDSLFRFDFRNRNLEPFALVDDSSSPMKIDEGFPVTISTTEDNRIWIVFEKVYELRMASDSLLILQNEYKIERKDPFRLYNEFNYHIRYSIYFSQSGNRWIFSNAGLYLLDKDKGMFREYRNRIPDGEFIGNSIFIWSWYDDGIYVYDQKGMKLSHIPGSQTRLVKAFQYQSGDLIWFSNCSYTGSSMGLNKIVFTRKYFRYSSLSASLNDIPAIYSLVKDEDGNIWAGMRGYQRFVKVSPENKIYIPKIPDYPELNNSGAVRTLIPGPNGLWVAFFNNLLLYYDFGTKKFTRFYPEGEYFRPVAMNSEGNLYFIGFDGSINIFYPELNKSEKFCALTPPGPIYKILVTGSNVIWAGSFNSVLFEINALTGKSIPHFLTKESYNIEDICEGDSGDVWLALLGGGVCNYNPETNEKKFYTTSDGLSNNITYGILKDNSGKIWVSTNTGVSRINPNTGIITTFGSSEGLDIVEFNSGAVWKSDDKFYMGGMGGFVEFDPDFINNNDIQAVKQKIIITDIGPNGKTLFSNRSLNDADTIFLDKGEDDFNISFSSSDFIHSEKTLYRYMLSEVDGNWVETDSRNRNVNYANLSPGWHTFWVQATDRSGSWSSPKELKIYIKPFYYQTALFKLTVALFISFLISGLITIYIRQIKQRESQKQAALRLQSLRGQMNPHFIFNSLNSINYFISNNDKISANKYIADFSNLIRSILHNLSHDTVPLDKEIESVKDYLKIEYLRFGDKFDYELKTDDVIDINIKICPGMIQPFIENAIWHGVRGLEGRKGKIEVCFCLKELNPVCIIKDDGIGRKKTELLKNEHERKNSRGIFIATERLKIINSLQGTGYQIKISDLYPEKDDKGTVVEIDLPVMK